jgi:hypothetical protein
MANTKRNKCAKCGHSYTSRTHRLNCLGLTLAAHHARNRNHARSSRACSAPDMGRILAPAMPTSKSQIVADGAFYARQPNPQPQPQPGGEA